MPGELWDFAWNHTFDLRPRIARASAGWRTPWEVVTGETPDISEWIDFGFYDFVTFKDGDTSWPDERWELGRWLGRSHDVGAGLVYWILKQNGEIVSRGTVLPISEKDKQDPDFVERCRLFNESIDENVGKFDEFFVIDDTPNDEPERALDELLDDDGNKIPSASQDESDPCIGATVFMPRGDRVEAVTIERRKRDADGNLVGRKHQNPILDSRRYIAKFRDGEEAEFAYNVIAEHLLSQVDSEGKQYQLFHKIVNHRKLKNAVAKADQMRQDGDRSVKKKTTAGWDLEVEWRDGGTSWLPLKTLKETNMVDVAEYAIANKIADEPAFDWWVPYVIKRKERLNKRFVKATQRHQRVGYKFGVRLPTTVDEALRIDAEEGTTFWKAAIEKEMDKARIAFEILEEGEAPPAGYSKIPTSWVFDVKMDFTRKARIVAGGHRAPKTNESTYASVVSRESVRILFTIAALNDLDVMVTDIGNAYLNAKTKEKVYVICGKEFGPEYEGRAALIVRALYGLASSANAWHTHLAETLVSMGFLPSKGDRDVWMKPATKPDGTEYYEYILVYVDDLSVISHDPGKIMDVIESRYRLKEKPSAPDIYLGQKIKPFTVESSGKTVWSFSAEAYLAKAIPVVESKFPKINLKEFGGNQPLPTGYHPEVDESPTLDEDDTHLYGSYIGILQWAVELGRIDIAHSTSLMARFRANPREEHLKRVVGIFAWVKKHFKSRVVLDPEPRNWASRRFLKVDWASHYPGAAEVLPTDAPEPRGKRIQLNVFVDASHATDLLTRRSTTGILIYIGNAPVRWYSKRQNTVESSTFGSEFVAMKIATEMIEGLRYKLRMLGIEIDGPANVFCDNESVVKNVTKPESTLTKKHNAVAYHKVREAAAAGTLRVCHEPGKQNVADMLTKILPRDDVYKCCRACLTM